VQAANTSSAEVPGIRFPVAFNPLRFGARHYSTDDRYYGYTITAYGADSLEICRTSLAVKIHPDDATRAFFRRVIVPVAGSLTAADGSKFHTSLRLFQPYNTAVPVTGRIVFHPQGAIHSDNDPSINYRLETLPDFNQPGAVQYWDDVVAAIGVSGLGTMDIIPDGDYVPQVDVRVWNDIHGLINGGTVDVYRAADLFRPGQITTMTFPVWTDGGKARMNVGVRTYGPSAVTVMVVTHGTTPRSVVVPGNSFVQIPLTTLLSGIALQDGQQVTLNFIYGSNDYSSSAFGYYTITENSSNDPRVVVKPQIIDLTQPLTY